ncbi:MAG: hypothetical protein PWP51_2178, partial [Clostridiales bacterium]|nr:hypothetical protein [Clostridiales bacterium]
MKMIRLIRNYQTSEDRALLEQAIQIAEKQTGLSE